MFRIYLVPILKFYLYHFSYFSVGFDLTTKINLIKYKLTKKSTRNRSLDSHEQCKQHVKLILNRLMPVQDHSVSYINNHPTDDAYFNFLHPCNLGGLRFLAQPCLKCLGLYT